MIRNFNDIEELKTNGFQGFKKIGELCLNNTTIPKVKGVYLVLFNNATPTFLLKGTGGFFKNKNPNVSIERLKENWVADSKVVYIGKAGSITGKATLYSRINQYLKFGHSKNIGHWGGRLVWQLSNTNDLIVCWKSLPDSEPREVESRLIQKFVEQFGCRPFANLTD